MENNYYSDLLYKKVTGTLSQEEDRHLQKELSANEVLRKELEVLEQLVSTPEGRQLLEENDPEVLDLILRWRVGRRYRMLISVAAALLIITGVAAWFLLNRGSGEHQIEGEVQLVTANGRSFPLVNGKTAPIPDLTLAPQHDSIAIQPAVKDERLNTLTVPNKKTFTLKLSDGTLVRLNSGSNIRFPFSFPAGMREIYLAGEAYLEIAAIPTAPFIIRTDSADITVIGTRLNVNTFYQLKATLISGKVQVSNAASNVLLSPGEQAMLAQPAGILRKRNVDTSSVLSWVTGEESTAPTPLIEMAGMIERKYGIQVIFENEAAKSAMFVGYNQKTMSVKSFVFVINASGSGKAILDDAGNVRIK